MITVPLEGWVRLGVRSYAELYRRADGKAVWLYETMYDSVAEHEVEQPATEADRLNVMIRSCASGVSAISNVTPMIEDARTGELLPPPPGWHHPAVSVEEAS